MSVEGSVDSSEVNAGIFDGGCIDGRGLGFLWFLCLDDEDDDVGNANGFRFNKWKLCCHRVKISGSSWLLLVDVALLLSEVDSCKWLAAGIR